jgi:hypothetical protein
MHGGPLCDVGPNAGLHCSAGRCSATFALSYRTYDAPCILGPITLPACAHAGVFIARTHLNWEEATDAAK